VLIVVFVTTGGKLVFIVSLLGGGLLIKGSALNINLSSDL